MGAVEFQQGVPYTVRYTKYGLQPESTVCKIQANLKGLPNF